VNSSRLVAPILVDCLERVDLLVRDRDRSLAPTEMTGIEMLEPRRSKTAEGRDFRELAFTDPDGHVVVLYQLDRGA
jgi:hypothetical protein